jgi:hypothetical protein
MVMTKLTAEERKARRRLRDKKRYENNREKLLARANAYNKSHKAERSKRSKERLEAIKKDPVAHEAYKARQKAINARRYAKHRDTIIQYVKEYNSKNKYELNKKAQAQRHRRMANGGTSKASQAIAENIEKINTPPTVLGNTRIQVKTGNFILTF